MKNFTKLLFLLAYFFSVNSSGREQYSESIKISRAVATALTTQTIEIVDREGVQPISEKEYNYEKNRLNLFVNSIGDSIEREKIYYEITRFLETLDSDKHTRILSSTNMKSVNELVPISSKNNTPVNSLVRTNFGSVLRVVPPQMTHVDEKAWSIYLALMLKDLIGSGNIDKACALVVDLTEQKGGNAWPPLLLLSPIFSSSNVANKVSWKNPREPLISAAVLDEYYKKDAPGTLNPLQRFAGQKFAVIFDSSTASAGEMLAIALLGEGPRVRSFGWRTAGYMTVNRLYALPDNATLQLSVSRYALGDGPGMRGGISPMELARARETLDDVVARAASWAAQQSQTCGND